MQNWYSQGRYNLTTTNNYFISKSYYALLGDRPPWKGSNIVWSKELLSKHAFIIWMSM